MAVGDILSCVVGADGWDVVVTFQGLTTGLTYNFGLDTSVGPTASTPYIDIVSEGYNSSGVLGTVTRRAYFTNKVRLAYPNQAQDDESVSGGNLVVRIALSTFIYDDDKAGGAGTSGTDPKLTCPAGFVTGSNAVSNFTVTNSSTRDYPKVLGQWSRPDRSRLTTTSVTLGAVAFGHIPLSRRPLAAVKFTAADAHSHTASTFVTTPSIDGTFGDAKPVIEWKGTVSLTGFTDDDLITCNFVGYPWVGDENSILDTAAMAQPESVTSVANYLVPSQFYVLDVDGSRGYPMCVVDPAAADDTLGVVYGSDSAGNRTTAATTPFKNLYQAVRKCYEYNNTNNGRANAQDATIYMRSGTHDIMGGVTSTPTTASTWGWTTFQPYPGDTNVVGVPNATSGNRTQALLGARFKNLTLSRSADGYWIRGPKCLLEDCTLIDTRTNSYQFAGLSVNSVWYVRCNITRVRIEFSSGSAYGMRGCTFPEGYNTSVPRCFIGNDFTGGSGSRVCAGTGTGVNDLDGCVFAFNYCRSLTAQALSGFGTLDKTYTYGFAFIQNVLEYLDLLGSPGTFLAGDGAEANTNDCIIWHNTMTGDRGNWFYNASGLNRHPHMGHSVSLNALEYYATKDDVFNAPSGGSQTARTGNWAVSHGTMNSGQRIQRGVFDQRFPGLYSKNGDNTVPLVLGYTDLRSGAGGTGGGNYHPTSTSVLLAIPVTPMLDFDLDGVQRQTFDAAGAFAGPTVASGSITGTAAGVGSSSGALVGGAFGTPPAITYPTRATVTATSSDAVVVATESDVTVRFSPT